MDKVKTIKNYLQNQKKEWMLCQSSEAKYRIEVYDELLEFIDSIKEEPTSDDLEEAANGYAWSHDTIGVNKETFSTQYVPVEKMVRVPIGEEIKTAVLFGAQWRKHQMMKDAIDATKVFSGIGSNSKTGECVPYTEYKICISDNLCDGLDKVKLIIIKEEQQ